MASLLFKMCVISVRPGSLCDSTALSSSIKDTCEIEVRFECSIGFDGNISPTIEFWMVTTRDKFALKEDLSEKNLTKATIVMVKKITSDFNDRYECRLRIANKGDLFAVQSDCDLGKIRRSCKCVND